MASVVTGRLAASGTRGRATGPGRPYRTAGARPAVVLSRRGRLVATGVSALAATLLSVVLATAAQAAHSGPPGPAGPGRYVSQVAVRPGQSLWTLAETYDPGADPRNVIEQIQQLNSMTSDQLQPGQVLWVPRA